MRSLWLTEALARPGEDDLPHLYEDGSPPTDVCIVGGGYTGLWTAIRLKELEPALSVAIVEGDICGGGASGRNGGFVLSWWVKFCTLVKVCGTEEALWLARASADAVSRIGAFCRENGIDAAYREDGYLWAATNAAQMGAWDSVVDALDREGERPFEPCTPAESARMSGSPVHVAAVFERTGATVQPALLARGLRRIAIERGVRIYERSPATGIRAGRIGQRPSVRTRHGPLFARRVILATNSWSIRHRAIRRRIVVVGSDIVVTPPVPERLAAIGWDHGPGISDSRLLVHYYRTTEDGRVVFGKGGGLLPFGRRVGPRFEGPSPRSEVTEAHFRATYPQLSDVPVESSWTGPVDRSRTGLPFFGWLGDGVLCGVGYSGNGVGPSYLGGRILASLALERKDEWSECALVGLPSGHGSGFPPDPIRFIGGNLVRAAIARKERAEDAGRAVGGLTRRLVGLAPAGLVPVKGR